MRGSERLRALRAETAGEGSTGDDIRCADASVYAVDPRFHERRVRTELGSPPPTSSLPHPAILLTRCILQHCRGREILHTRKFLGSAGTRRKDPRDLHFLGKRIYHKDYCG